MAILRSSAKLLCRLLLLFILPSISVQAAQPRFLHGLLSENPMALPPSAYQFFHPSSRPPAAQLAEPSPPMGGGEDGKMVLVLGFAAAAVFAMGVFYLRARRRADAQLMQLPPVSAMVDEKESGTKTKTKTSSS